MEVILALGFIITYWQYFLGGLIIVIVVCCIMKAEETKSYNRWEKLYHSPAPYTSNTQYMNDTYEQDDGRRLYGKKLITREDWDRWWTLKGFSDGIEQHLYDLEDVISSATAENAKEALDEWYDYYDKYRTVCLDIHCWNRHIEDSMPFVADSRQLAKEEQLKRKIQSKYKTGEAARLTYISGLKENEPYREAILNYIASKPGHVTKRSDMLREVSKQMGLAPEALTKIYRSMVKDGTLSEKKNGNRYEVKKARKKATKKYTTGLPVSVYNPANYAKVTKKTIYKIEYTVGTPSNVDREKNTCEFISKSSGEKYYTSLTKCTCLAYTGEKNPCKHMVALAIHLGYYHSCDAV